jgi:uncharacterized membrane protein (DUF485 family)
MEIAQLAPKRSTLTVPHTPVFNHLFARMTGLPALAPDMHALNHAAFAKKITFKIIFGFLIFVKSLSAPYA